MTIDVTINMLINDLKAHGSVLILGAGASVDMGIPLYTQFPPIIWQVVDEFVDMKTALGWQANINAKDIVGTDIAIIKRVFSLLENNELASSRFKVLFKNVNDRHNKNQSIVHEIICRLIHKKLVKIVVSFNWDDLLETAWSNLYGTNINDHGIVLIKPHGDIRNTEGKWIFPHHSGFLSNADIDYIKLLLSDSPSTFVILGYSESDETIVDTLIKPNESKYVVYRIAPSAYGGNAISMTAIDAMRKIKACLASKVDTPWRHVSFKNQVGLERAIMGCRLLPSDVIACPRLPQLEEAKIRLEQSHSVVIEGAPGSGKSITAYQLAWDYLQNGWEVLKLIVPESDKTELELYNYEYKTVFLIDDAQQMPKEKIIELLAKANKSSKLIITQTVTTDFPSESVKISQEQAVLALYNHYKKHKNDVLPIISETNKTIGRNVGDKSFETSFDLVLDVARKEKTAWLFNYSLRGGWQNTKTQYFMAKEHNRADILLAFIALKQILLLDKPINRSWLNVVLKAWRYDCEWVTSQLEYLYKQKLILSATEIRTLHLQMAIRIIVSFLEQADIDERLKICTVFQKEILCDETPLLGILWLYNMLTSFSYHFSYTNTLFDEKLKKELLIRCKKQTESKYRAHAGYILERIITSHAGMRLKDIFEEDEFLVTWLNNVDNETAYSYSLVLNSMINESQEWKIGFVKKLNSAAIANNIECIKVDNLYDWAEFLDRLNYPNNSKWSKKLYAQLPLSVISETMQKVTIENIYGLTEMLCKLRLINKEYCFIEYFKCIHIFEKSMKQDFMQTLRNIDSMFLVYIFGQELFSMKRRPAQIEKNASIAFIECITPEMIYKGIFEGNPRDWDTLYRFACEIFRYNADKFVDAIKDADYSLLDGVASEMWNNNPHRDLCLLLYMLHPCNENKTENWIYSNRDKMENISAEIFQFSPRTAEFVYNNKGALTFSSHRWDVNAKAIYEMKSYNRAFCIMVVEKKIDEIRKSLVELSKIDFADYHIFLRQILLVKRDIVDIIVGDSEIALLNDRLNSLLDENYYKSDRKSLQGLKKLISLIKDNSENHILVKKMDAVNNKIEFVLNNLQVYKWQKKKMP